MHLILETARRHISDAQATMQSSFDLNHPPAPAYAVGDFVFVSNQPFASIKTDPKWLGPFRIDRILNPLTVMLDLPAHWGTHRAWHVSHLKPAPAGLRRSIRFALVSSPPLQLETIVSHRRGRGRNNILLTVKYVDRPLGFHPAELSASDARRLSPDLVDSYLTRRRLQQAKEGRVLQQP